MSDAAELALFVTAVDEMMKAQQGYFAERRRGTPANPKASQDALTKAKTHERLVKRMIDNYQAKRNQGAMWVQPDGHE